MAKTEDFLSEEENVKRLAKFLYHQIPVRDAVQLNKRVDYFRGKKLTATIQEEKFKKRFKLEGEAQAIGIKIGEALLKHGYIHASTVKDRKRRELRPLRDGKFEADGYFTWIYQASSFKRNLLLGSIIFGFLSIVMFPIWPQTLKNGSWYVSVTFLLFFFVLINVRLFLFILLWLVGYNAWLFPNLFDDDASVIDSFIPFFTMVKSDTGKESNIMRIIVFVGILISGWYLYQQPTELDEILVIQRQFVNDLYEGKLLSSEEENVEGGFLERTTPDLETLQKELEEDSEIADDIEGDRVIDDIINEELKEP